MTHPRLTAIILTYNEAHHIAACISSLRFCDAVIVFDSFSTDNTPEIARAAGAHVIQHRFENYAQQRNAALEAVKERADWVLFVDADERVSSALAAEIARSIRFPGYAGFRIPRDNIIFGKCTRGAGWYPDYQTRLLRVGAAHYDPAKIVHEVVMLNGREGTLAEPLTHYNYRDAAQFHHKQRRYSAFDARILYQQGVRPKFYTPFTQAIRHFVWRFITLRGHSDGLHGLRLSLLMAWYEFRKFWLLWRLWADYGGTPLTT